MLQFGEKCVILVINYNMGRLYIACLRREGDHMDGITGITGDFSAAAAGMSMGSDHKDTKTGLMKKITTLKTALAKAETAGKGSEAEKLKLSLERRIDNLQKRLDKLEEKQDGKCQTCENRRYQDGSDDPGVSYKTATKISPEQAASAVKGHEMEHVYRNRAKAEREDRKVVSQSVTIHTGICPECGKPYVSGGETRTVTKAKPERNFDVGTDISSAGELFDRVA